MFKIYKVRRDDEEADHSLLLGGWEFLIALGTVNNELVLASMLNHAWGDELLHHVGGQLVRVDLILKLLDLFLHQLDLGILELLLSFLFGFTLFIGLDFRSGPSELAADLHHVGRDTFGDCSEQYKNKQRGCWCTYGRRGSRLRIWLPLPGPRQSSSLASQSSGRSSPRFIRRPILWIVNQ